MATKEKQTKAALNQSLFREVNERVRRVSAQMIPSEIVGFLCECADTACSEPMQLTLAEYEAIRLHPTRFPILPGHEWAAVERVVERYDHYEVVEKFGEAGRVAAEEWREGDADIANPS